MRNGCMRASPIIECKPQDLTQFIDKRAKTMAVCYSCGCSFQLKSFVSTAHRTYLWEELTTLQMSHPNKYVISMDYYEKVNYFGRYFPSAATFFEGIMNTMWSRWMVECLSKIENRKCKCTRAMCTFSEGFQLECQSQNNNLRNIHSSFNKCKCLNKRMGSDFRGTEFSQGYLLGSHWRDIAFHAHKFEFCDAFDLLLLFPFCPFLIFRWPKSIRWNFNMNFWGASLFSSYFIMVVSVFQRNQLANEHTKLKSSSVLWVVLPIE